MRVVILTDNRSNSREFETEHGLSAYIETGADNILYDTGKSDVFMRNAEKMGIDLSRVDTVVISHGHYDHIGGLRSFLDFNSKAKVYLSKYVFEQHYFSWKKLVKKDIGADAGLRRYSDRFVRIGDKMLSSGRFSILPVVSLKYPLPKGNEVLFKTGENGFEPDDFLHELVFVIRSSTGLTVFTGCAHKGVMNVVSAVKENFPSELIRWVWGGFHLIDSTPFMKTETDKDIVFLGRKLKEMAPEADFYTGHCTGNHAFDRLKQTMGGRLNRFYVGKEINL